MDYLVQNNDLELFLKVRRPEGCLLEYILEQIYARCCSETDLPNITKAKCTVILYYQILHVSFVIMNLTDFITNLISLF
jgi:hypothetical protein